MMAVSIAVMLIWVVVRVVRYTVTKFSEGFVGDTAYASAQKSVRGYNRTFRFCMSRILIEPSSRHRIVSVAHHQAFGVRAVIHARNSGTLSTIRYVATLDVVWRISAR
jgi:hypothetical protein